MRIRSFASVAVFVLAVPAFCVLALARPVAAAPFTFDTNNMGWSTAGITNGGGFETVSITTGGAAWASEPGNGYIKESSTTALTPRAYNLGVFGTAATLLGDLTGRTVQTDFRRVGEFLTGAGTAPTVRMVISNATPSTSAFGQATWYYSSVLTAPLLNAVSTGWETHAFDMAASNFFVWPNGTGGTTAGGTPMSFSVMLQNYSFIGFTILSSAADSSVYGYNSAFRLPDYGATATEGTSEFHVDNLTTVPEPTTLGLLGLGLVALARRARKHS